ncbi:hypothetical protein [Nesterenkonia pannonica]|uniref:hypothetical protein n=1 Tax=Nesterenkonia pannonica TaxID=1548602 RepID=UPI002164462D|nr:hypothetical protein [Nesterenkonia pannonica]
MTELTEYQKYVGWDALAKFAADRAKEIKADIQSQMLADYADAGISKRTVKHPLREDETVASITVPESKATTQVTSSADLIAWAQENRPALVETVTVLKDHAVKSLAAELAKMDDGALADPETGEEVPGLRHVKAAPNHVRITYSGGKDRQAQIVSEALAGTLPLLDPPKGSSHDSASYCPHGLGCHRRAPDAPGQARPRHVVGA